MGLDRRDFLKTGLLTGLASLMGDPSLKAFAKTATVGPKEKVEAKLEMGKWIASSCQGCTTWCPVEVMVLNGRAVKVKGNSLSKQNYGYVCPRGHLSLQQLYDPDRVKVPLKRTNPQKGKGIDPKFVPISWDEALDIIADKMLELRKNGEPHKFVLLRGRYTYMNPLIYDALPKIFGSPNNISHSSICAEAEKFGPYYTEGEWEYRDYDLDNCKYLVIWGCDPANSNRMVPGFIRKFGEVLDRATVVVVDPRQHTTASKAHMWLPIIPGTDGALAVALAHVILVEGLWNKEFVGDFKDGKNRFKPGETVDETTFEEKYTYGLVKWWNLELKDKTPAWAEKICGIPKETIEKVARGMGKAAPHVIVWLGPGACMHVRGAYTAMAIHALNGLLGSVDNIGGTIYAVKQPTKSAPPMDKYMDDLAKKYTKQKKI
ncbi:MAG: molybdopterin-dependent oxidoreductase, partial [Caldimicrobium sp.]